MEYKKGEWVATTMNLKSSDACKDMHDEKSTIFKYWVVNWRPEDRLCFNKLGVSLLVN